MGTVLLCFDEKQLLFLEEIYIHPALLFVV
jgi:hypothetical protein